MRVASTQMVYRYQKQLNNSYEQQMKLMEQADGSKLHRASDDSTGYSKYLRYQNSLTENSQYQDNVDTGISWMNTADNAMVNMKDILTTLKEKTVQAANEGTNTDEDLAAIAKEFTAKVNELVSLGNTQQGDRYMFAGQSDLTQPFVISSEKYNRGLAKTLDDPQAAFFSNSDSTGTFTQMLTLTGSDGLEYYVNTLTGAVYDSNYMAEGYKDTIAAGYTTVEEADAAGESTSVGTLSDFNGVDGAVSKYFDKNGVLTSDGESWSATITNSDGEEVTLSFASVNQYIVQYNGDSNYISMVKRNGTTDPTADSVNVTGQDIFGSNIFDDGNSGNQNAITNAASGAAMLNDLLTVSAKLEAGDSRWMMSDGITVADKAHETVIKAQAKAAARKNVYDSVAEMLDNQKVTVTDDISKVSDTDVAELAVDLMEMQTIYNLSLSVGSRILPQSLADYL